MPVNLNKPHQWKADIAQSVDMYNDWFMKFAPRAFRETRIETTKDVEATLKATENMTNVKPAILREHPEVLPTLRMRPAHHSLSTVSSAWPASLRAL